MTEIRDDIIDEAISWTVRLDSDDITFEEQQLFLQWLDANPLHREAFDEMEGVWSGFAGMSENKVREFESYAYFPVSRWHPIHIVAGVKRYFAGLTRLPVWANVAAAIIVLLFVSSGFYYFSLPVPIEYETATREQKTVVLEDGTEIYLNTKSKIAVTMNKKVRSVAFLKGEAFFSVAHHSDWPFVVNTGNGRIKVLGTKFNVYKKPLDAVTVSVLTGKVEVSDEPYGGTRRKKWQRYLGAGQEISFREEGLVKEAKISNIDNAISWRRGIIAFEDATLIEVVSEFNRYSDKKIVLLASSLSNHHLGGVFNISDIPMSIKLLEATLPIKVLDKGEYIAVVSAD